MEEWDEELVGIIFMTQKLKDIVHDLPYIDDRLESAEYHLREVLKNMESFHMFMEETKDD